MKDKYKDKSSTLFSRKSTFAHDSDDDKFDNVDSKEEYYVELASSDAMIVKYFGKIDEKKFNGQRKFHSKIIPSVFIKSDVGSSKKFVTEEKNEGKCFNCGGDDYFARDLEDKKE